ncbi:response regulator transcription factor [Duganella sp. LX20W]|uniref:Response regulator transcription factor n=1 Tax=Rugamonas brunnea TaxID=2758569 RepID=A0A7W2EST3_9BURK|nr:response regulator transcription factor [Rugamonas brunnea]MBA5637894.1 response regulator transcription factor [Rugamonas brunnea]
MRMEPPHCLAQRHGAAAACIDVLIDHEDAIVRAGLAALLQDCPGMAVRMEGAGPRRDGPPQVLITDYHRGVAHMRATGAAAGPRVLIVSGFDREWHVHTAMTAGVHGYLLQSAGAGQVEAAVRALQQGLRYLSPELGRCVADSLGRVGLTNRESDVLQLMAQGRCNKSIARELGIGVGTVKTHVKGLFDKLGATARTHAVVLAARRGLVGVAE